MGKIKIENTENMSDEEIAELQRLADEEAAAGEEGQTKDDDKDSDEALDDKAETDDQDTEDDSDTDDQETAKTDEAGLQTLFKELKLDTQFESAEEALKRIPDFNRYTDTVHKRNLELERQLADYHARKVAEPDKKTKSNQEAQDAVDNMFGSGASKVLSDAGFLTGDAAKRFDDRAENLEKQQQQLLVAQQRTALIDSVQDIDDLKPVLAAFKVGKEPAQGVSRHWDEMSKIYSGNSAFQTMPLTDAIPILYQMVKPYVNATKKPPVGKVSQDKKSAGKTHAGSSPNKGGRKVKTGADLDGMSEEQLLAEAKSQGLVSQIP